MSETYHHGDLRTALIEETLEMVRADEVHLIGFRELARRLDVSRTAPYRHFESVEDLLAAVTEEGFQKFILSLEKVSKKKDLGARERFLELGIAYVTFAVNHSAFYRLMFDRKFYRENEYPQLAQLAAQAFGLLRQTVAACFDKDAPSREVDTIANLAWACVHGLSSLLTNGQMNHIKDQRRFIRFSCQKLLLLAPGGDCQGA